MPLPLIHDIAPPYEVVRIAPRPAGQHHFARSTDLDLHQAVSL